MYSEFQVEQVWTCPGEGVLFGDIKCIMSNGHMGSPF